MLKFLLLTILFIGCSSTTNVPFVETQETYQLKFGMKSESVINILGMPLFVKSGSKDIGEVEWTYEVRYRLIKSNKLEWDVDPIVKKRGSLSNYTKPKSRLTLVFNNDRLVRWYTEEIINNQTKIPTPRFGVLQV